jgi:pimeloyl-ACP methyl ester carboxylesterase
VVACANPVAPDLRGIGHTTGSGAVEQYSMPYLVGDMVALLDVGATAAVLVGHDSGAQTAAPTSIRRWSRP